MQQNCQRLEQELAGKTSTINMLMKKMEQKCQEVKTAQQREYLDGITSTIALWELLWMFFHDNNTKQA